MYIEDCVKGILDITECDYREPINLGTSKMISINRLVDIVEEIAGIKVVRKYCLDAPLGVRGRNSDNTTIRRVLGWEPDTPVYCGMERTYQWIHDQMTRGPHKVIVERSS